MTVIDPQIKASAETIGLIAGGGQFPLLVAEAAKKEALA
jgi:DUF1009 family protein